MREQGKIYERKEIEKYLKEKEGEGEGEILSPVTQEPFESQTLYPGNPIRNIIDILVNDGAIEDKDAETWKNK